MLESLTDSSQLVAASAAAQLGGAFIAGFLSSLTPCVYPLIPVTLAIFGIEAGMPRRQAFLLATSYVLGIATTYTTLGVFSASTGKLFGSFLSNPWIMMAISILLVILSLSSLEIIQIRISSSISNRANRVGGRGLLGSYLMGLVSGVIAAPCIGPAIVAILTIAAASQNPAWGGLLFFVYSLGLGLIFIVLGTFSGLLSKVPRGGGWLSAIKYSMAVLILMVALFFSWSFISDGSLITWLAGYPARLIISTLVALAVAIAAYRYHLSAAKFVSAAALALTLYVAFVPGALHSNASESMAELAWIAPLEKALESARGSQRIVMLDLYADWCGACKEFDAITFADGAVRQRLAQLVTARVDFTLENDENLKIQDQYSVVGLPTILFLDSEGHEIPDSRITGFLPPRDFLAHLDKNITVK